MTDFNFPLLAIQMDGSGVYAYTFVINGVDEIPNGVPFHIVATNFCNRVYSTQDVADIVGRVLKALA